MREAQEIREAAFQPQEAEAEHEKFWGELPAIEGKVKAHENRNEAPESKDAALEDDVDWMCAPQAGRWS